MTLSSNPRNSSEVIEQASFSELYQNSDAETYANEVDSDTLVSDALNAIRVFSSNSENHNICLHAIAALVNRVRKQDEKIDSALKKQPKLILTIIKSEEVKTIHSTRQSVHECLNK